MIRAKPIIKRGLQVSLAIATVMMAIFGWRFTSIAMQDEVAYSPTVWAADGKLLRAYLTPDEKWRLPIDPKNFPDQLETMLYCLEDQRFLFHPGIDPLALGRAVWQNIYSGRVVSGASTITMQLARLRNPKQRNLIAKFLEAFDAIAYEILFTKKEILAQYLSLAPYGSNAEGIEAASHLYFGTRAQNLTKGQLTFLSLLPQNPRRFQRWNSEQWHRAMDRNLKRLQNCQILTEEDRQVATKTKIPTRWHSFPSHAPHFSDWLVKRHRDQSPVIETTIESAIQSSVEKFVATYRPIWREQGIDNASVLVVDRRTRNLVAIVGNQNYFDNDKGQKIPSFFVPRSPGSTLKPFLYSYNIHRGELLPEMLLEDTPFQISGYAPENFSGTYKGLVKAEDALSKSLNIPFVRMLYQTRIDSFVSFLESAGLTEHTPTSELGLSMILGGVEATPWSVTQLYLTLARGGKSGPIRYLPTQTLDHDLRVLSPGAVFLTNRALSRKDRPDYPERHRFAREPEGVSWKTGTSQGRRDAWSIGTKGAYLVAVWTGNLDQSGSPALVGAVASAPLMFDLLEALPSKATPYSEDYQDSLTEVEICGFSGYRPSNSCQHRERVTAIPGAIPMAECPFHKTLLLDRATGQRVFPSCRGGLHTKEQIFTIPPGNMRRMMGYDMSHFSPLPGIHPQCQERPVPTDGGTLLITSPKHNFTYMALASMGQEDLKLPLTVKSAARQGEIACFMDGRQIAVTARGGFQPVLAVLPGEHRLQCYDADGEEAYAEFTVEAI